MRDEDIIKHVRTSKKAKTYKLTIGIVAAIADVLVLADFALAVSVSIYVKYYLKPMHGVYQWSSYQHQFRWVFPLLMLILLTASAIVFITRRNTATVTTDKMFCVLFFIAGIIIALLASKPPVQMTWNNILVYIALAFSFVCDLMVFLDSNTPIPKISLLKPRTRISTRKR